MVPLEVPPNDPSAASIVLVAGTPSHPVGQHEFFAVMALIAQMLCHVDGVVPVMVADGWPSDTSLLERADAIILYSDGGDAHPLLDPTRRATIATQIARGAGFGVMHYAVEVPATEQGDFLPYFGGVYETDYSVNPLWRAVFDPLPAHPVSRGIGAMEIDDEWYYGMRWGSSTEGLTPILTAVPPNSTRVTAETAMHPDRSETTMWTYDRPDGGRSFGFTGGHWYGNWVDSDETPYAPAQRRVVMNAILWSAGVEVPEGGANVDLDPASIGQYLTPR